MPQTYTTMITSVRTRLGNPATDGFFTDAQIGDMINESLQYNNTLADWPWTQTTTTFNTADGTAQYTPPADWVKTRGLIIDGYDAMQEISLTELREKPTAEKGTPCYFAVDNEVIYLRPVPNAVYTVTHDYLQKEDELSGVAEPLMPDQWRYAIVEYAVYLAHMRQGDMGAADRALARFEKWHNAMADHRRRTTAPRKIRTRAGSHL